MQRQNFLMGLSAIVLNVSGIYNSSSIAGNFLS
jgi:hypothetical protein